MKFLILTITMVLLGFIQLSTPSPLFTSEGRNRHKRGALIWIALSAGIGAVLSLLEFQYW